MKKDNIIKMVVLLLLLLVLPGILLGCSRRSRNISRSSNRLSSNRSAFKRSSSRGLPTETTLPSPTQSTEDQNGFSSVPETTPYSQEKEPLVYSDTRSAHYIPQAPEWTTLRFEWICQDNSGSAWMDVSVDKQMYAYYKSLDRFYGPENFYMYANDTCNQNLIKDIVSCIRDLASDLSYDDAAAAREIVKFVQDCIEYQYDIDTSGAAEYPRYPIETLYERQGDCEDTSILLAALLKEWGYEVGFLYLPNHLAVAIRAADDYESSAYYEIDGHKYLFIETTGSNWEIGAIPEDYKATSAQLYLIP